MIIFGAHTLRMIDKCMSQFSANIHKWPCTAKMAMYVNDAKNNCFTLGGNRSSAQTEL